MVSKEASVGAERRGVGRCQYEVARLVDELTFADGETSPKEEYEVVAESRQTLDNCVGESFPSLTAVRGGAVGFDGEGGVEEQHSLPRPSFEVDGVVTQLSMPETIEILMMSMAAVILLVGKASVKKAVSGNIFSAGMNAMIAIFGIAWMGDTFFNGNLEFFKSHIADVVTQYPFLFSVALFIMSIMLFSQAATVRTLFPLGIGLGIPPLALVAMFPAVNGYFFFPNYPTEVAAINFDTTGTTRIGKYVLNHSFQLSGFITTFVSIGVGYLIITFLY